MRGFWGHHGRSMDPRTQLPLLGDGDPPEIVVHDELEPCPYLDGREARMPLRLPLGTLTRAQADLRFAAGDRRHGVLLYRTRCVGCAACVPLRVPIASFEPSRSMRRVLRRGDALLECSIAEPVADQSRLALYEEHKTRRGLLSKGAPKMTLPALRGFLV
ncbi:MAG: hypothetical protein OEY14_12895, partial [Myxococcales bacterium]|nr:hypothetical protein [Myxococcales bacterium]